MNHNSRIGELSMKRSLLKGAGRFRDAIPLQLEIIELLVEEKAGRNGLAMAHNMASVLYLRTKLYSTAEWHGRQALTFHSDHSAKGHEALGAYNRVMAQILACQYKFEEASRFGLTAIAEYSHWHTPPDDLLSGLIHEVEAMKNRTWTAPE
jgi:hypothetical protein